MVSLYELSTTVFKADTQSGQNLQYEIFKSELEKLLNEKDDDSINEALYEAENNGKIGVLKLIENTTQELINTVLVENTQGSYRSDFFLLPILIISPEARTNLLALNKMETFLADEMKNYELIPENSEMILSPILLSHKTSSQMNVSKWYDLHQQTLINADKRSLRAMFSKDFILNTEVNYPTLVFLTGVVIQKNHHLAEIPSLAPNLVNNTREIQNSKLKLINSFQNYLNSNLSNINIVVLEPNNILTSLMNSYSAHQELLISSFVSSYSEDPENLFIAIPINILDNFVLTSWNFKTNTINNYLLVEPFGKSPQENLDITLDYIQNIKQDAYLGESIINFESISDFKTFDMKEYIDENGVEMILSKESIEE